MRYKLTVEYDGKNYFGFQKQIDCANKTIEGLLEDAIFKLTNERIKIIASGRTDAGVHASGQVIHFDLEKDFDDYKFMMGINNFLREEEISILNCQKVDKNFHARFSAKARHYRYIIINRRAPLTFQKNRAWHFFSEDLDVELMKEATKFLIGEHDFSSFRDAQCQANSTIRTIDKIEITQNDDEILIDISAKSFLHHMVRNIVGTLAWIGSKKILPIEMKEILESHDRTKSGPNAPAFGLYFLRTDYD
jgi:tRNA pseudouridine38-40 synthase